MDDNRTPEGVMVISSAHHSVKGAGLSSASNCCAGNGVHATHPSPARRVANLSSASNCCAGNGVHATHAKSARNLG